MYMYIDKKQSKIKRPKISFNQININHKQKIHIYIYIYDDIKYIKYTKYTKYIRYEFWRLNYNKTKNGDL